LSSNQVSYEALRRARFMAFNYYPHSQAAEAFCKELTEELLNKEIRKRKRRAGDLVNFKKAVRLIVSDLLAHLDRDGPEWLYRSMRNDAFADSPVKGDTFLNVIKELERSNYINVVKGGNLSMPFSNAGAYGPGLASRFNASEALVEKLLQFHIGSDATIRHFRRLPSLSEVRLKSSSVRQGREKISGKAMRILPSDKIKEIKANLKELNMFLYEQEYDGMEFYGLKRIFNEGDRSDFHWNMGGRLYAIGESHYQWLKKEKRLDIKINQEPVVEIDINASFLRILHGLLSYELPTGEDIYAMEEVHREVVKSWFKCTLGHTGFHNKWPPKAIESIQKAEIKRPKSLTYKSLKPLIFKKYPVLSDWPNCGIRWSRLMYEESEGIIEVMRHLNNHNVPALPVHDSLIVPSSARELTEATFRTVFEHRFGVEFKFDVSSKV
jgi:hypothetical protein